MVSSSLGTEQHRKTISVSIPMFFVVKKDVQSYTITPDKNKSNVAANACEKFRIIGNIHKYPQILCQRWDYGFSHFVNFEVLNFSIVFIYVTPWIALLMRKYFLRQFLKLWRVTAYLQCDIYSTKSYSGFIWPATLQSNRWPCPRICALY